MNKSNITSLQDFMSQDENVNPVSKLLKHQAEKEKFNNRSKAGAFFAFVMVFASLYFLLGFRDAVLASIGIIGLVILINAKIRLN